MNKPLLKKLTSSIRAKMFLFMSLLIIMVMVSFFVFTDLVGVPFTGIESDYEEYFDGAVASIYQVADIRKDNINKKILSIAANIETFVGSNMTKWYVSNGMPPEGNQEFTQYLEDYRRSYNIFDNIQLADLQGGKIIAATRSVDIGRYVSGKDYITGAIKSRCYHICFAVDEADGDIDLYISHVIELNSQPRYVIVMNVSASDFFEALNSNSQRGDNSETVLADNEGRLLINLKHTLADGSKPIPLQFRVNAPIDKLALEANEGTTVGKDYRGVKVLAAYRYIPIDAETGWAMVVKRDYSEVITPYYNKLRYVVILIMCYLLAVLILTHLMIRFLTRPILILKKAACAIGSGKLDVEVTVNTKDELGQLANVFNKMVADLKDNRAELQRRKDFLQRVLDNTTNAVYSIDLTGNFVLTNQKVTCITGYSTEELMGRSFATLFDEDMLPQVMEQFIKASVYGKRVANFETTLIRKDGSKRLITFSITPTYDSEKIEMVVGTAEDITERRALEELRRLNEKRLEIMVALNLLMDKPVAKIMDFVLDKSIDLTGSSIGFISLGSEDETEFTVSTFSNNVMRDCGVDEEDMRLEHSGLWGEAVRQRGPVIVNDYETTALNKKGCPEGHLPLKNLLIVPTFGGNRIVMVTAMANKEGQYNQTDIEQLSILMEGLWQHIERKRLGDDLHRLNQELVDKVVEETQKRQQGQQLLTQQSKMAAMGEMISMIAHQWKQPLNVIAISAQDLGDAYAFGELDAHYMSNIQATIIKHVEFMVNTVDDFRKFLRPSKEKVSFDVKKAVEELVAMFLAYFAKDNCLIDVISEEPVSTYDATGYPNEFKQVILNIINNARDAILSKRQHELSTPGAKDKIEINISKDSGEKIIIAIRDTGGGIPEDIIGRVFDAHFTTKPSGIGTGIGLYMSKTIIETNMGWSLTVRNVEDGAEFRIEI